MEKIVQYQPQAQAHPPSKPQSPQTGNLNQSLFAKSYATNSTHNPEDHDEQDKDLSLEVELSTSHNEITLKMVKKLLSWLIEDASKQLFRRQVYAQACTFVKIYLQKTSQVKRNCFLIAAKMDRWGKLPRIDFDKFPKEQIERFEMQILDRLNYNFVTTSYMKLANEITYNWDNFMKDTHYYEVQYFAPSYNSYEIIKYFFEKLDCIYLTYQSHQYDQRKLVINTFFLESYKNCMKCQTNFILKHFDQIYNKKDDFWKIFQKFLIYIGIQKQELDNILDIQLGKFISKFFQLKIQTNSQQADLPSVHSLVDFFNIQTFNHSAEKIANLIQSKQI